ncbi:hypothetical protein HanRHA438_Chr13g0625301 [Helianthus annuus]|nr:hypothetical protein HanRHA438_Chr13g0625301 [Helianthus annuus]
MNIQFQPVDFLPARCGGDPTSAKRVPATTSRYRIWSFFCHFNAKGLSFGVK